MLIYKILMIVNEKAIEFREVLLFTHLFYYKLNSSKYKVKHRLKIINLIQIKYKKKYLKIYRK